MCLEMVDLRTVERVKLTSQGMPVNGGPTFLWQVRIVVEGFA
jgi:hypothetical protein